MKINSNINSRGIYSSSIKNFRIFNNIDEAIKYTDELFNLN